MVAVQLLELVDDQQQPLGVHALSRAVGHLGQATLGQHRFQGADLAETLGFGHLGFEDRQERRGQGGQRRGPSRRPHGRHHPSRTLPQPSQSAREHQR